MTAKIDQIEHVIRSRLAEEYRGLDVLDVRAVRGSDMDGDPILSVDVVFAGSEADVDAAELVSVVRKVRPALLDLDEDAFPIFSFISEKDEKRRSRPRQGATSR
jgi:hypothetical protein